ncbi:helix-turn-helix domain-containing protein [Agromyces archimandritae]|uniref:Helix-turn-helix domain-containing protein n=1 Tax=Agromyces archimandritae TaxID=2781962 RepID=A0A975IN06_9MICO|nr:helix-turn-helix domain-containing protein [Agromyces archimandritae]QTX04102.1 helix-turn-helix domain-containing protein [Agromyces archimandritae]
MTSGDVTAIVTDVTMTPEAYAAATAVSLRTVRRWLRDGELPGARKVDGAWMIPASSRRTPAAGVERHGDMSGVVTLSSRLDELPALLPLDLAAVLLGTTIYALRRHRDYFGVVPVGPRGSLVVPQSTIRRLRG